MIDIPVENFVFIVCTLVGGLFATEILDVHGGQAALVGTIFGLVGMGIAGVLFSLLRRAPADEPFSTSDLVGDDAYVAVSIPAGRHGSVLVKKEGQTHEFSATASIDIAPGTTARVTGLAIVACMDARLDVAEALGFRTGNAHIIRNAGGIVTDDVIRSLLVSQHLPGTNEVLVIAHTRCGLIDADEETLRVRLAEETGVVHDAFGAFSDLEASVRSSLGRLRAHAWLRPVPIHGLIFDVATDRLHEVVDG